MALGDQVGPVLLAVVVLIASSYSQSGAGKKRNLDDIKYKFTPCGAVGRNGPTYPTCHQYYTQLNSPQVDQNLLYEVDNTEISGAQGFHIPQNGLYNITISGARGGRGICNPLRGFGFTKTVQVKLSTEYDLLIFVGQRGTEPCDVIPKTKDAYASFCQEPAVVTNISDVKDCNETWFTFTQDANFDHLFYEAFGGGAGGGGSLVKLRRRNSTALDARPLVVTGGGGGTASVLDYDVIKNISVLKFDSTDQEGSTAESYRVLINASARTHSPDYGTAGMQGYHNTSMITKPHTIPGAGGGYNLKLQNQSTDSPFLDGRALHRGGSGGMDCTQLLIDAGHRIPYSGVYGGFGGGGGACGGGGGGGGYTGGAILAPGVTIPGEGGYSFIGDDVVNVSEIFDYNYSEPDGFVEIILANCGCAHKCLMTGGQYECLCPDGTTLALDLNDCFEDKNVKITKAGSLLSLGSGFYYKFIELSSSAFILSNHIIDVQITTKMCVLLWLGDQSQIVLTTDVVRYSGNISKLAMIQGSTLPVGAAPVTVNMLNSSVLVTGAILLQFGTGDCLIHSGIIHVNSSIQIPPIGTLQTEEFLKSNRSAFEQEAVALANVLFTQSSTPEATVSNSGEIAVIVIAMLIVITVVAIVTIIVGYLAYKRKRVRPWSSHYTIVKSSSKLKDSLILNAAYSKYSSSSTPPYRSLMSERDYRYEIFVHSSENDSYATLSPIESSIAPLHEVSTPQHDFSEFNIQRKNSLISDFEWSYPRGNLMYMRELGEGQFGKVLLMKAKDIAGYSGQIPVAVKTLTSRDQDVIRKFHEEAELMKKFSHPNIVSLLGFIQEEKDEDSAPLMILEYLQYGDLASFLRSHSPTDGKPLLIGEENFRTFAIDVALGLEFLSSMKYVHRDIAARNCLVGAGLRIKIADFGLARAVHNKDYYKVGGAAVLPVRWMAPESLLYGLFSSASDVWSFGILLWEIVSYGRTPLDDAAMEDIVNAAQDGTLHHARPSNCSDALYQLMSDCHKHNCDARPGFKDIVLYLSKINNNIHD